MSMEFEELYTLQEEKLTFRDPKYGPRGHSAISQNSKKCLRGHIGESLTRRKNTTVSSFYLFNMYLYIGNVSNFFWAHADKIWRKTGQRKWPFMPFFACPQWLFSKLT